MKIEMIEEFADLHNKLANLYSDAADEATDEGEAHDLNMLSLQHDLEASRWEDEAERWHRLAAKMSAEGTEYSDPPTEALLAFNRALQA